MSATIGDGYSVFRVAFQVKRTWSEGYIGDKQMKRRVGIESELE